MGRVTKSILFASLIVIIIWNYAGIFSAFLLTLPRHYEPMNGGTVRIQIEQDSSNNTVYVLIDKNGQRIGSGKAITYHGVSLKKNGDVDKVAKLKEMQKNERQKKLERLIKKQKELEKKRQSQFQTSKHRGVVSSSINSFKSYFSSGSQIIPLHCRLSIDTSLNQRSVGSMAQYNISQTISVRMDFLSERFHQSCPCAYDNRDKCRVASHLCVASNMSYFCSFTMRNVLVTDGGALFQYASHRMITLDDPTVAGKTSDAYDPAGFKRFLNGYQLAAKNYKSAGSASLKRSLVVPTRMRWDDCFNHVSFQAVPFISLVYELVPTMWPLVHWQASRFTAALLVLMDVPESRIIVERAVTAEDVFLPWIPHWNPLQLSSIHGISNRLSARMTKSLLSRDLSSFSNETLASVGTVVFLDSRLQPMNVTTDRRIRFVVYLSRKESLERKVMNEIELLAAIDSHLAPGYQLVVLPSLKQFKSIEEHHFMWRQVAEVVSRAKVIIGPHGGAFNNMIWAPDDCHVVEFNNFPDDRKFYAGKGHSPVRRVFLNAFWAKGGSGKFWIVNAQVRHLKDFYSWPMIVSPREVFKVLQLIDGGKLVKSSSDWRDIPEGNRTGFWDPLSLKQFATMSHRTIEDTDD